MEINGYVNKTYVNKYRQEEKTVTCYSKARCKHRISHVATCAKFNSGIECVGSSAFN